MLTMGVALCFGVITGSGADGARPGDPSVSFVRQAEDLRIRALRGDLEAKTRLAERYERGLGVPQNFATAFELYREAAIAGYEPAGRRLASLGVSLFPPPTSTQSGAESEPETGGQTLRLVVTGFAPAGVEDTSFFAQSQSIASREVLFVVTLGHTKKRLRMSRQRGNLNGPRRLGLRALSAKPPRYRAVGVAGFGTALPGAR